MNIFEKLKPQAHHSKNGFDLSSRQIFSAKVGQLLPILTHEVIPGDYFEIDCAALARTMPLNRAAFLRMKQYFHFFFVPYQQLWTGWNTFISQRYNPTSSRDNYSDVGSASPFNKSPYFNFYRYLMNRFQGNPEEIRNAWKFGTLLTDFFGDNYGNGDLCKLLDYLGYGGRGFLDLMNKYVDMESEGWQQVFLQDLADFNKDVNMFRILAYNKIYNDFYSHPYYDVPNPLSFNADYCSRQLSSIQSNYNPDMTQWYSIQDMIIKYRRWPNDYFMSCMPSSQFGDIVTIGFDNVKLSAEPIDSSQNNRILRVTNSGVVGYGNTTTAQGILNLSTSSGGINMLDLRYAEQLQKWRETTMRAGRKFKDQMKAHFGETPSYATDDEVKFIGGFSSSINIDEVVSTASTDTAELGDLAGKGIGALQGNKLKFSVGGDYGVIMCIYSCVPQSDYNSYGLDKANTLFEPFDYETPAFENLGLEPIMNTEISLRQNGQNPAVLGYNVRNAYLKTGIDKVHDSLVSEASLSSWVAPRVDLYYFRNQGLRSRDFHINPVLLDSVFAIKAEDSTDTDQLLINAYFDIKAIRKMSVIGLPF